MDDATIMPSTDTGSSAAVHDDSPYRTTNSYMCLYDNTAAMPANTMTHTVVVQRISRSPHEDANPFPIAAQSSDPSTRDATSRGTRPSGMAIYGELVRVPPRTQDHQATDLRL